MPLNSTHQRSRRRTRLGAVGLFALVALAACSSDPVDQPTSATDDRSAPTTSTTPSTSTSALPADTTPEPNDVAVLQGVLDGARAQLPMADATVQAAVVWRATGTQWASTSGPDVEADRPIRMASVGKTFTAATVLRLVETGAFGLDDPIGALLTPETAALLDGDGYDLDAITVGHLLQHTAGVYDYAFGDGSPFLADALADRSRVWTRREQLELAVSVGDPLFAPGDGFSYSDSGYVLLGEIIEVETGQPYADAMRELLGLDRLGLAHIWLESGQTAPADLLPIARSFFGGDEISDLDFSLDAFGGGGLAGTTTDIARFFDALLGGEVFADPASLATLRTVPATNIAQEEFGVLLGDGAHGVYRMDIDGQECWSHRGFLGTIAIACPAAGISVVVTTNTALTDPLPIAAELLAVALA